jgi:hypothetical protein
MIRKDTTDAEPYYKNILRILNISSVSGNYHMSIEQKQRPIFAIGRCFCF